MNNSDTNKQSTLTFIHEFNANQPHISGQSEKTHKGFPVLNRNKNYPDEMQDRKFNFLPTFIGHSSFYWAFQT